jgi:hypothetical protein
VPCSACFPLTTSVVVSVIAIASHFSTRHCCTSSPRQRHSDPPKHRRPTLPNARHLDPSPRRHAKGSEHCFLMDPFSGYSNIGLCPYDFLSCHITILPAFFQPSLFCLANSSRPLRPLSRLKTQYIPYVFFDYRPSFPLRRRAACCRQVHSFANPVLHVNTHSPLREEASE